MISDAGTAMQRDRVFADDQSLKDKMVIAQSDSKLIVPNVLMGGTPQKEVDYEFFLISVSDLNSDQLWPAKVEQVLDSEELRFPTYEQKRRTNQR